MKAAATGCGRGAASPNLDAFAAAGFNLSKLESRPQPEVPWRYLFYLDVEANVEDPRMAETLDRIRQHTGSLRILGCYPARAIVERQGMPAVGRPAGERSSEPEPEPPPPAKTGKPQLTALSAPGRRTVVTVGDAAIGGDAFTLISGPCAVESRDQILAAAEMVAMPMS